MAARRGRGAAAEPPPPPPPEPIPEPEPEKTEEPPPPPPEPELPATKSSISKDGKVIEKTIERIIICPGMQNQYGMGPQGGMMAPMYPGGYAMGYQGGPPPAPPGPCPCLLKKCSKKKSKKKKKDDGEPCTHPFCIVQRAKIRPQGLPWASGLYPGPSPQPPPPKQPPVVICQRPILCCCSKCRPPEDSDSEEEEEDDPHKTDTETFMTFMNLVFAASNVINERPEIL